MNTQNWELSAGMLIQRVDNQRLFIVDGLRVKMDFVGTQYQTMNVEVDLKPFYEPEIVYEFITVTAGFFKKYVPARDPSEIDQN
jgi:hypothetical protein